MGLFDKKPVSVESASTSADQQANRFERLLKVNSLKYSRARVSDGRPVVAMNFGGGNFSFSSVCVNVVFDDDGESVHLVTAPIVRVDKSKLAAVLAACNEANMSNRWAKFYVNGDCNLMCDADAEITDVTCGDVCLKMALRTVAVIDNSYPTIMKAVWS